MLMLLETSFLASSSVGNKTSQVAKLLQIYFPGMPALFKVSSNFSLFKLASLLVFMSVTTNDTTNDSVFGSTACTNSGIGKISFSLKYLAYLFTL